MPSRDRPLSSVDAAQALGAALLRYRMSSGLSLRQLARRLGMQGHGGLSDYEKGRRIPPVDLIDRYSEQLRITDGELHALHAAALAERATRAADRAEPTRGPVIAELPRTPPDFRGREAEIAAVLAAAGECLAGRGPVTVLITGQPGAGKTTLAVRAAARAVDLGLRDAQIFVELTNTGADPAILRLLRALGVPDGQLPPDTAGAAALLRSRLAGRRAVLVLDDARDEAQIRPLLPGPGPALVLVTSRHRLTGLAGVRRIALGELAEPDAEALLSDIVGPERAGAEPAAVAEVVAACGRLPLAVRIAGNRLAGWPGWSVAHLAELLRDEQRRLQRLTAGDLAVRSAFGLSYRRVPPLTRRLFRRLSLAAGPDFGVDTASVLLLAEPVTPSRDLGQGITCPQSRQGVHGLGAAEQQLDALAGAGLVEVASTPGRYRLHDLLRLYAAERLAEEESEADRDAAERALVDWLFSTARTAAGSLAPLAEPYPGGRAAALEWLDAEADALLAATEIVARRKDLDPLLAGLTQQIPWYYDLRCRWQDMVEVASRALQVAERNADRRDGALAHSMLGLGQVGRHRYTVAIQAFEDGLSDARATGFAAEEAELHGRLGLAYEGLRRYAEAEASHAEHVRRCHRLGDRWGEAAGLGRRSHALRMLGRHDEAASCLQRALRMRTGLGDDRGVAMAEYRFGALRNDQRRYAEALERERRALTLFEAYDDQWGRAVVQYELGRALAGLRRLAEAASAYHAAIGGLDRVGEWERRAEAQAALSNALDLAGRGGYSADR